MSYIMYIHELVYIRNTTLFLSIEYNDFSQNIPSGGERGVPPSPCENAPPLKGGGRGTFTRPFEPGGGSDCF